MQSRAGLFSWRTIPFAFAAAIIIAAPLSLLAFPHAIFHRDWENNLWMIEYARVYFLTHGGFPATYDVVQHVGITQPIFYGPLLYPCLAVLSLPWSASIGVRIACSIVCTLQFILVFKLGRAVGASRIKSIAAAALVSWTIYPLTNLYNRGALAEFLATTLLLCGIIAAGVALLEANRRLRAGWALLGTICGAMAVASHGPTAIIGGFSGVIFTLAALFDFRHFDGGGTPTPTLPRSTGRGSKTRHRVAAVLGLILIAAVIASPWAYVAARFSRNLAISIPGQVYYPMAGKWTRFGTLDDWRTRLNPLPIESSHAPDPRTTIAPTTDTPNVDTQWNAPLALLAAWNLLLLFCSDKRRIFSALICTSLALATAWLALSISPALQNLLPIGIGAAIQFPYRLVSHVNLAMLVLLMATWLAQRGLELPGKWIVADRAILTLAIGLSATALAMKLSHAAATMNPQSSAATDLTQLPPKFIAQLDYSLVVPGRAVPPEQASDKILLDVPIGRGPQTEVQSVHGGIAGDHWVVTSIMNFPWNRLVVDGNEIPFSEVYNLYYHETVHMNSGDHSIGYEFVPDPAWLMLRRASWITLDLALAAMVLCFALGSKKSQRPQINSNPI